MDNKLLTEIQNSPLVQAAITEAVHRFYHDRVLSKKNEDKQDLIDCDVSNILSTLWNLQPNWRYVIKNRLERFMYVTPNTNAVDINSRLLKQTGLTVTIKIG